MSGWGGVRGKVGLVGGCGRYRTREDWHFLLSLEVM